MNLPFAKIKSDAEYNSRQLYVYDYAPLIFLAIEKEVGNKKMWEWLNTLLTTPTKFTNYDFLISTLEQTLSNNKEYDFLKREYFESDKSLENAIAKLKKE
jgi:hypothetical protein